MTAPLNARAPIVEAHASIHTHRCSECRKLRVCLQREPCSNRILEYEHRWVCAQCAPRESQEVEHVRP